MKAPERGLSICHQTNAKGACGRVNAGDAAGLGVCDFVVIFDQHTSSNVNLAAISRSLR